VQIQVLKSKIHLATVTGSDLHYEGSIAIDKKLCKAAGFHAFERVDIYNCATGARFSTYVILGKPGEISLNGAAARLVQKSDKIIIAAYGIIPESQISKHTPIAVFVDSKNQVKSIKKAHIKS
jgi:aspartate 1-decarboxylase